MCILYVFPIVRTLGCRALSANDPNQYGEVLIKWKIPFERHSAHSRAGNGRFTVTIYTTPTTNHSNSEPDAPHNPISEEIERLRIREWVVGPVVTSHDLMCH